jgi:thiol-disulfide isomerase/thioredoxin
VVHFAFIRPRLWFARALACLVFTAGLAATAQTSRSHQADVGDPAPSFELQDMAGKTVRLSAFQGKIVILNFWATWCVPCRKEVPLFLEMEKKYRGHGLAVIGIDMLDVDNDTVAKFVHEQNIDYPILIATDDVSRDYVSDGKLPVTVVIGLNGTIVKKILGAVTRDQLEATLQSLFPPS